MSHAYPVGIAGRSAGARLFGRAASGRLRSGAESPGRPTSVLFAILTCFATGGNAWAQGGDARPFAHEPHREVSCQSCHESRGGKVGAATVTEGQCRSCHHQRPQASVCTRCHATRELSQRSSMVQQFRFSVSPTPVSRTVVFGHQEHGNVQCRSCHQAQPRLSAGSLSCTGCHEQHHTPDADCQACHDSRPVAAHGNAVHLGCGGSDCHRDSPIRAGARTRQICLTCHAERTRHYPATNCVDCHVLPAPAAGPARL